MTLPNILVTGANGFVGRAVCAVATARGLTVGAATRTPFRFSAEIENIVVDDIGAKTRWQAALQGRQVVVHAAARVHVMAETSGNALDEFRRVNVQATLNLAEQSAAAGVGRFVFISSVKVNGEETQPGHPFKADDAPAPLDVYGVSKLEAEQGLKRIANRTGMELVVVRPPLVYGPGVKANFAAMMRWLRLGVPLPLGAIHNQRSLVGLDNLADLMFTCLTHPAAANQTFLVSDGHDVSTTELLRRMGQALNRPVWLIPVPAGLLTQAAALLGKAGMAQRLCGSLQVDIEKTRKLLGWQPPLTLDQCFRKAVEGLTT